jgi:hypothetical protein
MKQFFNLSLYAVNNLCAINLFQKDFKMCYFKAHDYFGNTVYIFKRRTYTPSI